MELLPLVCLCLLSCSGDAVRVVVEEDSDAVLPCLISTEEDISGKLFDWSKDDQKEKKEVFLYDAGLHYNNGLQGQDEQFKGRVSFFQDQLQNGNASIKITRTKMADSGNYNCDFPRHQPRQTSIIELVVARVRVVVEEDSDAVLPCLISPKEDLAGKLFDWKKDGQKEMKEVFLYDAGNHYNNGRQGQDDQFKGRVSFFQDQLQNGDASIKITGTKMADSGNYSCDFPRHQPRQTSIIELVVGLAAEPVIKILAVTKDGVLLQCEARGVPRPTIKWQDSDNKTLPAEEPQISERGGRFYITGKINVTKTNNYSCVATQKQFSHQVTAMIPVYIQGAASAPHVKTIQTDKGVMLQCKVLGASPKPKVEWKDSSGNVLQTEEPQVTESGGRYDIVLRAAVTKTDTFRCVVTQKEISHQIYAETYASVSVPPPESGSSAGLFIGGVVCGLLVAVVYHFKDRIWQICVKGSRRNRANGPTGTSERPLSSSNLAE